MVDKKAQEKAEEAVKDTFEDRPTLESDTVVGGDVLAHNWQPGSPAVDLRYAGVSNTAVNVVTEELAAKERAEDEKHEKAKPISEAEMDRRSKLDVSNPEYLNPSLDHVKVK